MPTVTLTVDELTLLKVIMANASESQTNMAKAFSGTDYRFPDGTIPNQAQIDEQADLAVEYEALNEIVQTST